MIVTHCSSRFPAGLRRPRGGVSRTHPVRVAAVRRLAVLRVLTPVVAALMFAGPARGDERDDGPVAISGSTDGSIAPDSYSSPDAQLRRLIDALVAENPQIQSARARSRSLAGRAPQARSLPDLELTYGYFAQTPETRVGPQEHTLGLSQGIPWPGKRALQSDRAEQLAASGAWEARDVERTLVVELKRAYLEAAYLQEALIVNSEERELLRRFEAIALKRYATGTGIQQNVVRVQTDISRLTDRETELQEHLDAVVRGIAEHIGRPETEISLEPIRLRISELQYETQELEEAAVAWHPRVRAAEARIEADRLWARRRTLESRPDFRFGIGYTQVDRREDEAGILFPPEDNGKDIFALTVGIRIPVYRGRIRGGVAEAQESLRSDEDALRAIRNRLRLQVQEAVLRIESLAERGGLYRDVIVPQAEESLGSAEAAYSTNQQGFLDLLEAERILFQVRLAYHRLVSDYWMAIADLEFTSGGPFPAAAPAPQEPVSDRGPARAVS